MSTRKRKKMPARPSAKRGKPAPAVTTGGRERTKQEFAGLFAKAGLKLVRVVPTKCPRSLVEAVRA